MQIFMALYSFVSPFREAEFCGVPSCVFDKLVCAAGDKYLRDTALDQGVRRVDWKNLERLLQRARPKSIE
jgi:hypothetical protein